MSLQYNVDQSMTVDGFRMGWSMIQYWDDHEMNMKIIIMR